MRTIFPRLYRSVVSIFGPPFHGLWLILLVYYAVVFLVCPDSTVLKGNLPDPDDYMYLNQVIDWLNGQGWYDNVQHRLNPPEGVVIHFSRLTMLPMAALILLFKHLGVVLKNSALLMAMIYPLLLFGGFFIIIRWVAKSFMPRQWTGVTAYIAILSLSLIAMFYPGHVDHHGLMIMIVALALGCALRMMERPETFRWGLAAGAILAIGMVLALEILPWVLIISAWLGLWGVAKGRKATQHGFFFGASFFITCILGLLVTRSLASLFAIDLLTYSIVYVYLGGGIMVSFASVAVAGSFRLPLRMVIGGGTAVFVGAIFLHRFPELLAGPYGAMAPELASLMLAEIAEASPLIKTTSFFESIPDLIGYMPYTLVALATGPYLLKTASAKMRWQWGLLFSLLLAAFLATAFYQLRFDGVMEMLAIIPLAVLLQKSWGWAGSHWKGAKRIFGRTAILLFVLPLPVLILPALTYPAGFARGLLLFPAAATYNEDNCDMGILAQVLNDPENLGNHPRTILNNINEGPELLFRTLHSVLAAPYHNDVTGNVDAHRFFSASETEIAEDIAHRRHADLVISCTKFPNSYLQAEEADPYKTRMRLIEKLVTSRAPVWLKPIDPPELQNFVIYQVHFWEKEEKMSYPTP